MTIHFNPYYPSFSSSHAPASDWQTVKQVVWNTVPLCNDVVEHIFSFLSFKELLTVERVEKVNGLLTGRAWQRLRKTDHFLADWSECRPLLNKHKWHYLFGAVIQSYVDEKTERAYSHYEQRPIKKQSSQSKIWKKRFAFFIKNSSTLGTYLSFETSLSLSGNRTTNIAAFDQKLRKVLREEVGQNCGGELFIRALLSTEEWLGIHWLGPLCTMDQTLFNETLTAAANNHMTYASVFLSKFSFAEELCISMLIWDIAFNSAEQGDYRGLEMIAKNANLARLELYYQADRCPPPLLYRLAYLYDQQKNSEKASFFFEQAIRAYKDDMPIEHLAHAVQFYQEANQLDLAEPLLLKLVNYSENTSKTLWLIKLGVVRCALKKDLEALKTFQAAALQVSKTSPPDISIDLAHHLFHLKDYQTSQQLYKQAYLYLRKHKFPIPRELRMKMALSTYKAKQFDEAFYLFKKVFKYHPTIIDTDPHFALKAANAYFKSGHFKEALALLGRLKELGKNSGVYHKVSLLQDHCDKASRVLPKKTLLPSF